MQEDDSITVDVSRNGQQMQLQFTLKNFVEEKIPGAGTAPSPERQLTHKKDILRQKHKFAPTIHELHQQERQLMMEHGKIPKS